MSKESNLQSKIASYLRRKGCYVLVTTPGPGVPTGCPDIIALAGTEWIAIECKADAKSKFQPLQEATLNKLKVMSPFVYVAYPANWEKIKSQLEVAFF